MPRRDGPRTSWDPTKAIAFGSAIDLIDAYMDPGLPISRESVPPAFFHETASGNTPRVGLGPGGGFSQLEAKDNTRRRP
jgi:hypothetical protein